MSNGFQYAVQWLEGQEIPNPIGQPLMVAWQENGQIQYYSCKNYEEMEKVIEKNWGKHHLRIVKSVNLSYGEVGVLAAAERVKREVAEAKLAHEKRVKEQKEADEKEYQRLKEKLHPNEYGSYELVKIHQDAFIKSLGY